MAKKNHAGQKPAANAPIYADYQLSDMSAYYIYGKGSTQDYQRNYQALREEIRVLAYGKKQPSKKTRGLFILATILLFLSILVYLVGYVVPNSIFAIADGTSGLKLIIDALSNGLSVEIATLAILLPAVACVIMLLTAVVAIVKVHAKKAGKGLKVLSVISCVIILLSNCLMLASQMIVGIGLFLMLLLAILATIVIFVNKK